MLLKKNLLVFLSFFLCLTVVRAESGWVSLFNGKDLSGWIQRNGKAKFEVKNGMIVGTTVAGTPNSFLCTKDSYKDFVLELELKVAPDMNSGIQFRSLSLPEVNDGRVHGYQCEVDPSARAWSGGIYDEARRGWLYPLDLNPAARSALKLGQWNKFRIECIGNSLRTWVNGVPVAHVIDDMTSEGFIALQVHGIGNNKEKEGEQIMWRNIRIKTDHLVPALYADIQVVNLIPNNLSEVERRQGFRLLFDGVSTDAWMNAETKAFPTKGWEVKDGVLTIHSNGGDKSKRGGDIITREQFGAFEFTFEFNFTEGANSGVKYGIGNNGLGLGLEYQILDDKRHPDAQNGVVGNRTLASLYDLIPAKKEKRFVKGPGQWNRGRIIVSPDGKVQHWLNGRKVVEYTRGDNVFKVLVARSKYAKYKDFGMAPKGPILLQDHNDTVHFRSLKIREL